MEQRWHETGGVRLEVLAAPAAPPGDGGGSDGGASGPPLLFIHGAFHGAWCYAEHFLPFFAAAGHDCYALSLRGHGASELGEHPAGGAATLRTHLDDIASFVATLARPPVLVLHSTSGLLAAPYASQAGQGAGARPPLAGLVMLASVPPSGNGPLARRTLWSSPLQTLRVVW